MLNSEWLRERQNESLSSVNRMICVSVISQFLQIMQEWQLNITYRPGFIMVTYAEIMI